MSTRKPLAGEPGYVCSLRAPFGFVAVLDRENGAEVNGQPPGRWFVAAYDKGLARLAILPASSQRTARTAMKAARARGFEWLGPALSRPADRNDAIEAEAEPMGQGEEFRTLTLNIGGREESFRLRYVNGRAQPSMPENESYMRGWNAVRRHREEKDR